MNNMVTALQEMTDYENGIKNAYLLPKPFIMDLSDDGATTKAPRISMSVFDKVAVKLFSDQTSQCELSLILAELKRGYDPELDQSGLRFAIDFAGLALTEANAQFDLMIYLIEKEKNRLASRLEEIQ